jgi:hypothetical protein
MQSKLYLNLIGLAALALTIAGCGIVEKVENRKRLDNLDAAMDTYRKMVRWGDFEQAAAYLKTRDGSLEPPDFKVLKRFKVTRFEFSDVVYADGGREAQAVAVIEFYEIDTGVTRNMRDKQVWWFDEVSGRWHLGSPMPDFVAANRPSS